MKEKAEQKLRVRKIVENYTDVIKEDNLVFIQKEIEVKERKLRDLDKELAKLEQDLVASSAPGGDTSSIPRITRELEKAAEKVEKLQNELRKAYHELADASARQTDKTAKDADAKKVYDQRMKDSSFTKKDLRGHDNQAEIDARDDENWLLGKYDYSKKSKKQTLKEYNPHIVKQDASKREHRETELVNMQEILADYKTAKEAYLAQAEADIKGGNKAKRFFVNIGHKLGFARRDKHFGEDTKIAKAEQEKLFAEKFEEARTKLREAVQAKLEARGSTLVEKYKGTDKEVAIDAIVARYDSIMLVNHMIGREVDNIKAAEKEIFATKSGKAVSKFFAKAGHIVSFGGIENKKVRKVARFAASTVVFGLAGGAFGSLVTGATYVGSKIARTVASGTAGTLANRGTKMALEKIAKRLGKYTSTSAINSAYQAKEITLEQYIEEKRKLEKFENLVKTLKTATGITAGIGTSMATSVSINNHFGGSVDTETTATKNIVQKATEAPASSTVDSSAVITPIDSSTLVAPVDSTIAPIDTNTLVAPADSSTIFDQPDSSFTAPADTATIENSITADTTNVDNSVPDVDTEPEVDPAEQTNIDDMFDNSSEDELLGTDLDDKTFDDIIEGRKTAISAKDIIGETEPDKVFEVTVEKGKGAISMFRELQKDLLAKHPDFDPETAPDGPLKDLMTKDPHDLAIKYNYYNPEDINESAHIGIGDKFVYNEETGQFLHETANPNDTNYLLEKGDGSEPGQFDGKFGDTGGKHGALGDHDSPRTAPPVVNVDTQQEVPGDGAPYAKNFYDIDQNKPIPASAVAAQQAVEKAAQAAGGTDAAATSIKQNAADVLANGSAQTVLEANTSGYAPDVIRIAEKYVAGMSKAAEEGFLKEFDTRIRDIFGTDVSDKLVSNPYTSANSLWDDYRDQPIGTLYENILKKINASGNDSLNTAELKIYDYLSNGSVQKLSIIDNLAPETHLEDAIAQIEMKS